MSFFDDISDFFSSSDEALPEVSTEYVSGLTNSLPEIDLSSLTDSVDPSSFTDSIDLSSLYDNYSPFDYGNVLEYTPMDSSYSLDNLLNTWTSGYDTVGMDKLLSSLSEEPATLTTPALNSLYDSSQYVAPEDVTQYLAPESSIAQMTDPVQQLERLQSAGVYGMSPDTGTSYSLPDAAQTTVSSVAPAYMGTGSDSFNQYYDPQTGVVPTNAGIPLGQGVSWWTKLMSPSQPGGKSNLVMGLQAALMAAQIAGALQGNKGSSSSSSSSSGSGDITTAGQAKTSIKQTPSTKMTWNTSGIQRAEGGPIPGNGPVGALGLLRGASPGQRDNVPISASHGEYVMDADTVSALGDGNTDAGAARLDEMRRNIRRHKRSAPASKIPPKAKAPQAYLKGAK